MPGFMRADSGTGSIDSNDQSTWNFGTAGTGAGGSTSSKPSPKVYMGSQTVKTLLPSPFSYQTTVGIANPAYGKKKKDNIVDVDDAKNSWYSMSDLDRENWGKYAVSIGLLSADDANDYTKVVGAWEKSVDEASKWYTDGKQKITPYQAATLLASHTLSLAQAKATKAAASADHSGSQTQKTVTVNLTDPTTARAVVASAMQQYLGQDPSDEQVSAFTKTLNDYEQSNPSVSTTKNVSDAAGNVTSHTTTKGGATQQGEEDLINHQVMSLPDYGAYQAATTYMGWLESALNSPVGNQ